MRSRRGFSLIELLIVIAIMWTLSQVAIPNFVRMSLRAKASEEVVTCDGIKTTLVAHEAAYDELPFTGTTDWCPGATLGKKPRPWGACTWTEALGWRPSGNVYGRYRVVTTGPAWEVQCETDLDANGVSRVVTATASTNATVATPDDF